MGVPITTKDCISVKGLLHTAGLWCRKDIRSDEDAEAMGLMRKAGAIPLAITNVSECCMWYVSMYHPFEEKYKIKLIYHFSNIFCKQIQKD